MFSAVTIGLTLLLIVTVAQSIPPLPVISETFTSWVSLEIYTIDSINNPQRTFGYVARDLEGNKMVLNSTTVINNTFYQNYALQRYDLNESFVRTRINFNDINGCQSYKNPYDFMFKFWDWVQFAVYLAHDDFTNIDIWMYSFDNETYYLGVSPYNPNQPLFVYYIHTNPYLVQTYMFSAFDPSKPPDSDFDIPPDCPLPKVVLEAHNWELAEIYKAMLNFKGMAMKPSKPPSNHPSNKKKFDGMPKIMKPFMFAF